MDAQIHGWMEDSMDGWAETWVHGYTNARLGLRDTRVGGCVGGWAGVWEGLGACSRLVRLFAHARVEAHVKHGKHLLIGVREL